MSVSGKNPAGCVACNALLVVIGLLIIINNPLGMADAFPRIIILILVVLPLFCSYYGVKSSIKLRVGFKDLRIPPNTPSHMVASDKGKKSHTIMRESEYSARGDT